MLRCRPRAHPESAREKRAQGGLWWDRLGRSRWEGGRLERPSAGGEGGGGGGAELVGGGCTERPSAGGAGVGRGKGSCFALVSASGLNQPMEMERSKAAGGGGGRGADCLGGVRGNEGIASLECRPMAHHKSEREDYGATGFIHSWHYWQDNIVNRRTGGHGGVPGRARNGWFWIVSFCT